MGFWGLGLAINSWKIVEDKINASLLLLLASLPSELNTIFIFPPCYFLHHCPPRCFYIIMLLALSGRQELQHWPTDTRLTFRSNGMSDWSRLLMKGAATRRERISVRNSPPPVPLLCFSSVSLSMCFSVSHFLSHCVSVSLLTDAGRARSVWFRAVSWRRIGSIYSLVCSGPHWPEVSVCFSVSVSLPFIYFVSVGLLFFPVLPSDKKTLPSSV